jgi:glycosyltransferase involved in cell wall biosynthesis
MDRRGRRFGPGVADEIHLHLPSAPGALNFAGNLLRGIARATGDVVIVMEDDDYYAPTHLERIIRQLEEAPRASAAGDDQQRYYHLPSRRWRIFQNRGASLCQTAFRAAAIPLFAKVVQEQLRRRHFGVDGGFWQALPKAAWTLARTETVVGMKGLPGQIGLGIGHRPTGPGWQSDRHGDTLRRWLGMDAEVYLAPAPALTQARA